MIRRERADLELPDRFSGRLALMVESIRKFNADAVLRSATWEPHDWGDLA